LIVYLKVLIAAIRLLRMKGPLAGEFKILALYQSDGETILELPINSSTKSPGLSSLFWDSRRGHALVERIEVEKDQGFSSFKLVKLYTSNLPKVGQTVWLSGWLGHLPEHFGLENQFEEVKLPNGTTGWLFDRGSAKWVIHVHGRRAEKGETLRNVEQFSSLGFSQLTISMATDPKPHGLGITKSQLGDSEWVEVEQAISFAKAQGAKQIILFGWSQGALIIGSYLNRAKDVSNISGVVFDSPLLDYRSTMRLHAKKQGFLEEAGDTVIEAIRSSKTLRALGYRNTNTDDLSLLKTGLPMDIPLLALYSSADGYVAIDDVHILAASNKNVQLVEISGAGHCRLYNHDTRGYQEAIATWLKQSQI